MRFIVRNCAGREWLMPYLQRHIPGLIVSYDDGALGAMGNFRQSLELAGDDAAVNLEDDIILTKDFVYKCLAIIEAHADMPVQFFSMRKKDLEVGTRVELGRTYLMNQCFYLPPKMSKGLLAYSKKWPRIAEHPTGCDVVVADYFSATKQKYLISVPSLVDHREGKSAIDPRRSSKRQSLTFEEPELEGLV